MRNLKSKIKNYFKGVTWLPKSKRGFTLLETLVALAVFSLAVWGPVNLALYSLRVSQYARNQVTAFYLAQEAMEYVRNIRDMNSLMGDPWLDHTGSKPKINLCMGTYGVDDGCCIDVYNDWIKNFSSAQCAAIKYDSSSGRYNYSTGVDTKFGREIWVDTPYSGRPYEAQITVEMKWKDVLFDKSFIVQEHLFDWK